MRNQTLTYHQNSCALVYDEDQCNSIKLQAIELSGACVSVCVCVCVCVCVFVCVLCVCCGGMYVIISFRVPTREDKGSVGMLQTFR